MSCYTTNDKRMMYEMIRFPRKTWDRPLGIVWRDMGYPTKYSRTHNYYAKGTKRRTGEAGDLPPVTGGL